MTLISLLAQEGLLITSAWRMGDSKVLLKHLFRVAKTWLGRARGREVVRYPPVRGR